MPLAAIRWPRRRSIVSSMPTSSGPVGHEGRHQQAEQDATGGQAGPLRAVEHAVVALKAPGLAQAHHPQRRGDGALAGSEERAGDQHQRVRPDAAARTVARTAPAGLAWRAVG